MSKFLWKSLLLSPAVLGATLVISAGAVRAADNASLQAADSKTTPEAAQSQTIEAQTPEVKSVAKDATPSRLEVAAAPTAPVAQSETLPTATATEAQVEQTVQVKVQAEVAVSPKNLEPASPAPEASALTTVTPVQKTTVAQATPAAEGNTDEILNQINRYNREGNASQGQVTNVTQLRDVSPGDWAYEALRSLVERYGCIAGYPDGTYRGNRAMSRYEFAAGVNSCLQQIERLIAGSGSGLASRRDLETLQRLVNEFQPELATLRTRVDNLEGRTASLENRQFSTTTKLFGQAIFGLQGRSENSFDVFLDRFSDQGTNINLVDNVQL